MKVMPMGLSCMTIGTKIYDCLVMEKMVGDNCFRFSQIFAILFLYVYVYKNQVYIY